MGSGCLFFSWGSPFIYNLSINLTSAVLLLCDVSCMCCIAMLHVVRVSNLILQWDIVHAAEETVIMAWDLMRLIFIDCQLYKRHSRESSSLSFQCFTLHAWTSVSWAFADGVPAFFPVCFFFLGNKQAPAVRKKLLHTTSSEFSMTFWFEHSFVSCDQCVKIPWKGYLQLAPNLCIQFGPITPGSGWHEQGCVLRGAREIKSSTYVCSLNHSLRMERLVPRHRALSHTCCCSLKHSQVP